MTSRILATAALLATTMLTSLTALKPAAASRSTGESVTRGIEVSENFIKGEGSDECAVIIIIAGVAVAFVAAASRASMGCFIPKTSSNKTTQFKARVEYNLEPVREPVKTLSVNPPDTSSYIALAHVHFKQGDRAKAIECFNEAILINPHSASLYGDRANFRNKKLGDKQAAIEDYNEAIRINPHNAMFYFWRSQIYYDIGNAQRAIEDYNEALRLAPEDTMYYCFQESQRK